MDKHLAVSPMLHPQNVTTSNSLPPPLPPRGSNRIISSVNNDPEFVSSASRPNWLMPKTSCLESSVLALPNSFSPVSSSQPSPLLDSHSYEGAPKLPPRRPDLVAKTKIESSDHSPSKLDDEEGPPEEDEVKPTDPATPAEDSNSGNNDSRQRNSVIKRVHPAVYRRFMEQRVANFGRMHKERDERLERLESEMAKVGLDQAARQQMRLLLRKKESSYMRMQRTKMDQTMFNRIKRLGVGAFGKVWLVRKKDNGQLYAMKLLNKRDVVERRQLAHVQAERDILAEADNQWVVKLFFSFQDVHALYLVMEYIPG
ncbi:hypothetical protein Ciccas_001715 [Cichlidogyrus casuarinus]|uniref:non-specific serine/threonine protein kinase n=1 Tax=Cichlidogyrus casuarinus TaxID=1844966 RepID=A0ABD2QME4_9PLAT